MAVASQPQPTPELSSDPELPPTPEPVPNVPERQPTNARWLALLVLTAGAVALGTGLTLRGAQQLEEEERVLGRELTLQNELTQLAQGLELAELSQAAFVGTGRPDYAASFRAQRLRLDRNLSELARLRPPQNFSAIEQKRLSALAPQTRGYLAELEHAVVLRQKNQNFLALEALEQAQTSGQTLQKTITEVRRGSERENKRQASFLRLEGQRQRAEAIVRATLFAFLLLGAYLLLRAERRFSQQRLRSLQRENERLRELTEEDGLTGLSNRRAFDNRIDIEWQRAQRYKLPLSVIVLDVDKFKSYNDTFGHPAGDTILRQMANALAQTARLSDTVARYGGEEFALILPHTDAREALIVGERLKALILRSEWPHRPITASIGIATLTEEMTSSAALVKSADQAQYFAKENGRNRVVHFDQL